MTSLANNTQEPRPSTETDRRHLLAESATPSRATSILESAEATPKAESPPPYTEARRGTIANPTQQPYRGFSSEAEYLSALKDWAESKKYIQPDSSLVGFYGTTTMEEYASRPKLETGISKKMKEWKARKEARRRSAV